MALPTTPDNKAPILAPIPPGSSAALAAAEHLRDGVSARTWRAYESDLRIFAAAYPSAVRALGREDGRPIVQAAAQAWVADMRRSGAAPRTIRRRASALRSWVRAARRLGAISWDLEIALPRTGQDDHGPLPPWDALVRVIADLEAAADGPGGAPAMRAARDCVVWCLALFAGLRRGEIRSIETGGIDRSGRRVRVRPKGRADHVWVPVGPRTMDAIGRWMEIGRPWGALVTAARPHRAAAISGHQIARIVRARGRERGIDVRPHDLRRAAITRAMEIAGDAALVRDYARHASMATTSTYARPEARRLAALVAAVEAGEPRE